MKLFLVTICAIGIATAAKLPSNNYLPPPSGALGSGGHSGILQSPSRPGGQYLPPTSGGAGVLGQGAFGGGSGGHGGSSGFGAGGFGAGSGAAAGYGGGYGAGGAGGAGGYYKPSGQHIPILKYENVNNGDGTYHFEYATGNGISQHEQGYLNNPGSDYAEQVVQGTYSYTGDDGHVYTVHYKADANGFQATGDHLPTPPPIPEAIQKSLIYNAQHGGGAYDDGQYRPGPGEGAGAGAGVRPQGQYIPPSRPSYTSSAGYHY